MSDQDQCAETPLLELARSVPVDLRGEWEIQWADDGTPTGHSMAPVGSYIHRLADEIERLTTKLSSCEHERELDAKLLDVPAAIRRQCEWREVDEADCTTWESACGEKWVFEADGPTENNVQFCQGCGKPVEIAVERRRA